jgi:hypothetical protein
VRRGLLARQPLLAATEGAAAAADAFGPEEGARSPAACSAEPALAEMPRFTAPTAAVPTAGNDPM